MTPLRIAMVTTFYPPYNFGGDGIYVQRLAGALHARGHHVEVIHDTDGYRMLAGHDPAPGPEAPFPVHQLRSDRPAWAALKVQQTGRPSAHKAQLQALLGDRFDVIHYHNVSLVGGPGVWALGQGVKLHTAHEHWLVCPTHILWKNNTRICDRKTCLSCVLRAGRPPQLWRMTGLLEREARHVDAFLTLSQSAADNHARFGFSPPIQVAPSFLPDDPDPQYRPHGLSRPFVLFVGRLEKIKGLQDVIPQMAGLPFDLVVAGDGDYADTLKALANGAPNIRFLGRQSLPQLRSLYRDALAVVTPSRCYEVFPLVVLEAFREGTPIIARDLGPYPEIVKATGGGLLFTDATSLKAALHKLAAAPDLARLMGQKALAAFQANWTEDAALEAYFAIIRQAAGKAGKPLAGIAAA